MASSNRNVLLGLRLSSLGLWVVGTAAVLLGSHTLLVGMTSKVYSWSRYPNAVDEAVLTLTRGAMIGSLVIGAIGLLFGFYGRYFCLGVTTAVGTAGARVKLATVLEAASLLSGAALFGVTTFGSKLIASLPPMVEVTWMLFTGLAAYMARVQFHLFLRSLAEHVAPPLAAEVKGVSRLYLYVPGGYVLALGVFATGQFLNSSSDHPVYEACGIMFGWLIATVATAFALFMVWRWSGLIASLRTAVAAAVRHDEEVGDDDDPDAEYRRRYHKARAATA